MQFPKKDAADVLDETFNWANWLAVGEEITLADVSVAPSGLVIADVLVTDATNDAGTNVTNGGVSFTVSGGVLDTKYVITCQITTSNGNVANRNATLLVKDL